LCDVHIALTLSLASGFATPRIDDLIQYKNKYKYGTRTGSMADSIPSSSLKATPTIYTHNAT
jgi:hypothetical protein